MNKKIVLFRKSNNYYITNYDNYFRTIQNAREIIKLNGIKTTSSALNYLKKYCNIATDDILIKVLG